MSSTVLAEYLVALGFKVDESGAKKTTGHLDNVDKYAKVLGKSVFGVQAAVTAMVSTFTYQMEKLYYASRRTGSAVGSIQALEYGAKQIGISSDTMRGALENMSRALRTSPGLQQVLEGLGVKVEGRDRADVLTDMVAALKKMPFFVANQFAGMFGMDADTLFMMQDGLNKLKEAQALRKDMARDSGVDTEKAAEAAKEYANVLRELWERVGLLKDAFAVALLPSFKEFAQVVNLVIGDLVRIVNGFKGVEDFAQRMKEGLFGSSRSAVTLSARGPEADKKSAQHAEAFASGRAMANKVRSFLGMPLLPAAATDTSQTPTAVVASPQTLAPAAPQPQQAKQKIRESLASLRAGAPAIFADVEKRMSLPAGTLDKFWRQESGRGANLVGPMTRYGESAQGHFQFMSGTAKQYGVTDPQDLQNSAEGAGKYISHLLKKYGGDMRTASAAYNWGPGNVAKYGLGKAPLETRKYMDAVAGPAKVEQTNNITVTGMSNAQEIANRISQSIDVSNAELVRNFTPQVE